MYAVIRAGGKQYRVAPGDVVRVEKLVTGTDGLVEFPVLAVSSEEGNVATQSDARVVGQAMEEGRGAKILVFHYTAVRITEIAVGGQSFKAPDLPKKEAKPKKVKAEEPAAEVKAVKSSAKKAAPKKAAAKKSAAKKK